MNVALVFAMAMGMSVSWSPCIPESELMARLSQFPQNVVTRRGQMIMVETRGHVVVYKLQPGKGACSLVAVPNKAPTCMKTARSGMSQ